MSVVVPSDREYLTAAEAAAEQLPTLPTTKRGMNMWLNDHNVPTRPRAGRGGGREFSYRELPAEARAEYLKRYGRAGDDLATDDKPSREIEKQLRAQARAAIVDAVEKRIAETPKIGEVLACFAKLYKARKAGLEPWVYENQPKATPDQVRVWRRKLQKHHGSIAGLIDSRGRDRGDRLFDRDLDMRAFITAQTMANPHFRVKKIQSLVRIHKDRDIPLRTLQRWISEFRQSNSSVVKAMTNPDAHRSHHKPAVGTRSYCIEINDLWELDATPGDALCLMPDGSLERWKSSGIIDVGTRRTLTVLSDQPRGIATIALLRRAILKFGVPKQIRSDNGKEFKNAAVVNFCRELNIALDWSDEFCPEQKPHIERFFHTMNDDLFEMLPGYVGHNVSDRKGIEARKSWAHRFGEEARITFQVELSPGELQARIDAWCCDVYEARPHEGLGMPPAVKALQYADKVRWIADPRVLDQLLCDQSIRTIGKRGVRIGNRFYATPELFAIVSDGMRVRCFTDPLDPSWTAVYRYDGSEFICIAKAIDVMEPSERQRVAVQSQNVQRAVLRHVREDSRKVLQLYPSRSHGDTLLLDAARANTPIAEIPLTSDAAEAMDIADRPRLIEHLKAIEAREAMDKPPAPVEPSAEDRALYDAKIAELEPPKPSEPEWEVFDEYRRPKFIDDDHGFFDWALARIAAGEPLSEFDTRNFDALRTNDHFQKERQRRAADQPSTNQKGVA